MNLAKRVVAYTLIGTITLLAVLGVLGIWGIVDWQEVFSKLIFSLLIIFASASLIIFIMSMLLREEKETESDK